MQRFRSDRDRILSGKRKFSGFLFFAGRGRHGPSCFPAEFPSALQIKNQGENAGNAFSEEEKHRDKMDPFHAGKPGRRAETEAGIELLTECRNRSNPDDPAGISPGTSGTPFDGSDRRDSLDFRLVFCNV